MGGSNEEGYNWVILTHLEVKVAYMNWDTAGKIL